MSIQNVENNERYTNKTNKNNNTDGDKSLDEGESTLQQVERCKKSKKFCRMMELLLKQEKEK